MLTNGLTPGTDALRAAIRAKFANNDVSAQLLAVAVSKHLKDAGWLIVETSHLADAETILRAILAADERGQGIGYSEAMNAARAFVQTVS